MVEPWPWVWMEHPGHLHPQSWSDSGTLGEPRGPQAGTRGSCVTGTRQEVPCLGQPGWLSGLVLPSAQGVILETWDHVPRQAPCMGSASPSACVSASLSLSLSLMNE